MTVPTDTDRRLTEPITARRWSDAGARLVAKALAEFSYEQLIDPRPDGAGGWALPLAGDVTYTFTGRRRRYGDIRVDPGSVRRRDPSGERAADDPTRLLLDLREPMGVSPITAGHLIRELAATQLADVHIAARPGRTAEQLVDGDYTEAEAEMDGHPWLVPNKGRLGFGATDYLRYAPERAAPFRLPWLAVRRGRGTWRAVPGLTRDDLLAGELDAATRVAFEGLAPSADHLWFPVHPWQLEHVVLPLFAADLAGGSLVLLGEAPDRYLPQQSVRTMTDVDVPGRHHVKLPLSVLNTLVWRGLPTERTMAAPAVTEFLLGIRDRDPFLRDECRLVLLGEVASVTVEHDGYAALPGAPYQYLELLGCIWRESVYRYLEPGEQPITMAALLHVDRAGRPVLAALVERSGLAVDQWVTRLLGVVLPPLLRMLYQHGVVFSPHGQNTILLHRSGAPSRLVVKDFVDDVNIADAPLPELADLPAEVAAVLLREPTDWICQFLWAGLFLGHFRYLADLLESRLGLPETTFWRLCRAEIRAFQGRFPQLADRYALFDLLRPEFPRICLNRNRLLLDGYADRPERPHAAVHGLVPNPLAEPASPGPAGSAPAGSAPAGSAPAGSGPAGEAEGERA
jgi:siderophore synthetase component